MGTLAVRNLAQKVLMEDELQGQISDGMWENATPHDHWKPWCDAEVVVDPANLGRNFHARKDNYNFLAKDLLEVVADRMIESVRDKVGLSNYDMFALRCDLKDLKQIVRIQRPETDAERARRLEKEKAQHLALVAAQERRAAQATRCNELLEELGVRLHVSEHGDVRLSVAKLLEILEASKARTPVIIDSLTDLQRQIEAQVIAQGA